MGSTRRAVAVQACLESPSPRPHPRLWSADQPSACGRGRGRRRRARARGHRAPAGGLCERIRPFFTTGEWAFAILPSAQFELRVAPVDVAGGVARGVDSSAVSPATTILPSGCTATAHARSERAERSGGRDRRRQTKGRALDSLRQHRQRRAVRRRSPARSSTRPSDARMCRPNVAAIGEDAVPLREFPDGRAALPDGDKDAPRPFNRLRPGGGRPILATPPMQLRQPIRDLLLATWEVDARSGRRAFPAGFEPIVADGRALVSVACFRNRLARLGPLPVPPYTEIDVRTFVVARDGAPAGLRPRLPRPAGRARGEAVRRACAGRPDPRLPRQVSAPGLGVSARYAVGGAPSWARAGRARAARRRVLAEGRRALRRMDGGYRGIAWQDAEPPKAPASARPRSSAARPGAPRLRARRRAGGAQRVASGSARLSPAVATTQVEVACSERGTSSGIPATPPSRARALRRRAPRTGARHRRRRGRAAASRTVARGRRARRRRGALSPGARSPARTGARTCAARRAPVALDRRVAFEPLVGRRPALLRRAGPLVRAPPPLFNRAGLASRPSSRRRGHSNTIRKWRFSGMRAPTRSARASARAAVAAAVARSPRSRCLRPWARRERMTALAAGLASLADCSSGARTLSEPGSRLYPETGNGGYKSVHTDIHLVYDALDEPVPAGHARRPDAPGDAVPDASSASTSSARTPSRARRRRART